MMGDQTVLTLHGLQVPYLPSTRPTLHQNLHNQFSLAGKITDDRRVGRGTQPFLTQIVMEADEGGNSSIPRRSSRRRRPNINNQGPYTLFEAEVARTQTNGM
jgi:hypothetical protein